MDLTGDDGEQGEEGDQTPTSKKSLADAMGQRVPGTGAAVVKPAWFHGGNIDAESSERYNNLVTSPLKPTKKKALGRAMATHSRTNVLVTKKELMGLAPGAWLNDSVVNFAMDLLQDRDMDLRAKKDGYASTPRCHFMSPLWFPKLIGSNTEGKVLGPIQPKWANVETWYTTAKEFKNRGYKIKDCQRVVVPINDSNKHWALAVINIEAKQLEWYDSIGKSPLPPRVRTPPNPQTLNPNN